MPIFIAAENNFPYSEVKYSLLDATRSHQLTLPA